MKFSYYYVIFYALFRLNKCQDDDNLTFLMDIKNLKNAILKSNNDGL